LRGFCIPFLRRFKQRYGKMAMRIGNLVGKDPFNNPDSNCILKNIIFTCYYL
jgi:hypothetical protein